MFTKIKILIFFFISVFSLCAAQKNDKSGPKQPALVVGIVVDQMRYDYLYRFSDKFGSGGFRRLLSEGFSCTDANFNYVPTHTAPGHACIFTGTTPSINGIIGNDWYDRKAGKTIYCVSDSTVKSIGTTSISGKMSPKNLLSSTFTDELRMSTKFKSRVFGISLKDRGAILPAGHTANAAYWHDPYTNNWVSSSYYMEALPKWAVDFNSRRVADSLLSFPWKTMFPIGAYTESGKDDSPFEGLYKGETKPVFPHDLPSLKSAEPELIRKTPFGNTFTRLFAETLISAEKLGKGDQTDVVTISFSSTDYVGHMYGTEAVELEDTYIRLDSDLSELLNFLDKAVGKNNYLLFLTADHGAACNPDYLASINMPSGFINDYGISDSIKSFIKRTYQDTLFWQDVSSSAVYLNRDYISSKKISGRSVESACAEYISTLTGVASVFTFTQLQSGTLSGPHSDFYLNGFYSLRSPDISIQYRPGWLSWYNRTGTTHGTAYSYDTHVPLIFYGFGVQAGRGFEPVHIVDIAPSICTMLDIEFPNGCSGMPIQGLFRK